LTEVPLCGRANARVSTHARERSRSRGDSRDKLFLVIHAHGTSVGDQRGINLRYRERDGERTPRSLASACSPPRYARARKRGEEQRRERAQCRWVSFVGIDGGERSFVIPHRSSASPLSRSRSHRARARALFVRDSERDAPRRGEDGRAEPVDAQRELPRSAETLISRDSSVCGARTGGNLSGDDARIRCCGRTSISIVEKRGRGRRQRSRAPAGGPDALRGGSDWFFKELPPRPSEDDSSTAPLSSSRVPRWRGTFRRLRAKWSNTLERERKHNCFAVAPLSRRGGGPRVHSGARPG